MCEGVTEAVEDIFSFKIPKGLELEPFGDVVFELLDFGFDECEGAFQGVVGETCKLKRTLDGFVQQQEGKRQHVRGRYTSFRQLQSLASATQSHT